MKRFILLFLLTFALTSCAGYHVHPGAANQLDSVSYDVLKDAQTAIDLSRPQFDSGAMPANLKPAFNGLIKAYDTALPLWKAYHVAALDNPTNANHTALDREISNLSAVLAAFSKGN